MTLTQSQQTRLLYLITALLLFMQSLTLWHDVEHAFYGHVYDAQCERFEAFASSPTLDTASSLSVVASAVISALITPLSIALVLNKQRDTNAIRAPPTFFS